MAAAKKPIETIVQLEVALKQFGAEAMFSHFMLMVFLIEQGVVKRSVLIAFLKRVAAKYDGEWQAATMRIFYEQLELLPSETDVRN